MNRSRSAQTARNNRNANPFRIGDVVTYKGSSDTGVVVSRNRTQVIVQTAPGQTEIWYSANAR